VCLTRQAMPLFIQHRSRFYEPNLATLEHAAQQPENFSSMLTTTFPNGSIMLTLHQDCCCTESLTYTVPGSSVNGATFGLDIVHGPFDLEKHLASNECMQPAMMNNGVDYIQIATVYVKRPP